MKRFIVLSVICGMAVLGAGWFLYRAITPRNVQSQPTEAPARPGAPGTAPVAVAPGAAITVKLPERLRRALEDRNEKYHAAKIRLSSTAMQFLQSIDSITAKQKVHDIQFERAERMAQAMVEQGGESSTVWEDVPPAPGLPEYQAAKNYGRNFESAFKQYQSEVQSVDYQFYKEFADVYGKNGEKKRAEVPADKQLDGLIFYALKLNQYFDDVVDYMTSGNYDVNEYLQSRIKQESRGEQSL
jgi:hypothetical protein